MSFSSLNPPRLLKSKTVALEGQGAQLIGENRPELAEQFAQGHQAS